MSWTMWHVNGSGFDVAEATPEAYKKFVLNHESSLRCAFLWTSIDDFIRYLKETDMKKVSIDDIRDAWDGIAVAEPIAIVIHQETDLHVASPGLSDEGEDYVLFGTLYPWHMTERERKLTSYEELKEILMPYAKELGVPYEDDADLIYSG